MNFRNEEINNFKLLFAGVKPLIEAFDGCEGVKLVQDISDPELFFTLSSWQTEQHLENYRTSVLFADTWTKTKAMFKTKAQAWSTQEFVG